MYCEYCKSTGQIGVPNWTTGTPNYRLDKIQTHEAKSTAHLKAEKIMRERAKNLSAMDILQPV